MSKQKHTQEPWVFNGPLENTSSPRDIKSQETIIARMEAYEFYVPSVAEANANAERIVACVNALAGWADPENEIQSLKQIEKEYYKLLKEVETLKQKPSSLILLNLETGRVEIYPIPHSVHPEEYEIYMSNTYQIHLDKYHWMVSEELEIIKM